MKAFFLILFGLLILEILDQVLAIRRAVDPTYKDTTVRMITGGLIVAGAGAIIIQAFS